jgi:peroxiredoxin
MKYLYSLLLILLLLFITKSRAQLAVGDTAINFILPDTSGNLVSFLDYSGGVVLLNFFATWCIPCSIEAPQLQDSIWNVYKNRGFTLIGIDFQETRPPLISFIDYYNLTFPIVRDTAGNVFNEYGLIVLPSNVLINQFGIVVWAEPGFDIPLMSALIDSMLQITSVPANNSDQIPDGIEIISTYPNPFNNQTNIRIKIRKSALTKLKIYDITGRLIKTVKQNIRSGVNNIKVDMSENSSGIYFYSILAGDEFVNGKFLLYK